jgi:hypothetical protein
MEHLSRSEGVMRKLGLFFMTMFSDWLSRLSGPASVPLAVSAFMVSSHVQKIAYGGLAASLGLFSAYRIWLSEYEKKVLAEEKVNLLTKEFATRDDKRSREHAAQVEKLQKEYFDARPVLGLRLIYSNQLVEFSMLHLAGRPALNVKIDPIRSLDGNQTIHFDAIPYVSASPVKQPIPFDVIEGDRRAPTDPRIVRTIGLEGLFQIFLKDRPEGVPSPVYETNVRFSDDGVNRLQSFRLTFQPTRYRVDIEEIARTK